MTLVRGESPGLYPELIVVRAEPPLADEGAVYRLTLPYAQEMIEHWNVTARDLGVFRMEGETWRWSPVAIDAEARTTTIDVSSGTAWAVGPSWMMKPWQQRRIVGADLRAGERNALVLHGWNGEPWEPCSLELAAALGRSYDNVAQVAYPSALDIAENGAWLRNEIEARYDGVPLDIIAFSEGGLVARAAIEPQEWNGDTEIAAEIGRLVTIATPHEGIEPDAPLSLTDDVAAGQMRDGSSFLRELNDGPQAAGVRYELIGGDRSVATDGVVPLESALAVNTLSAARAHDRAAGAHAVERRRRYAVRSSGVRGHWTRIADVLQSPVLFLRRPSRRDQKGLKTGSQIMMGMLSTMVMQITMGTLSASSSLCSGEIAPFFLDFNASISRRFSAWPRRGMQMRSTKR